MFTYGHWLRLPIQTRHAVAQVFNIHKRGPTHVVDNVVKDDGYPIGDVETALEIANLQAYTGLKTADPIALWDATIEKVLGPVIAVVPINEEIEQVFHDDIKLTEEQAKPIVEVAKKKSYYKPVKKK